VAPPSASGKANGNGKNDFAAQPGQAEDGAKKEMRAIAEGTGQTVDSAAPAPAEPVVEETSRIRAVFGALLGL
jgi:hypothetical protein